MSNVNLESLASTITNGLNLYAKSILDGVKVAAEESISHMVQTTKQRTNKTRHGGKYVRCIASQVGENSLTAQSRIWYVNKPRYSLTHLLNNGHRSRSGGFVPGDGHVTHAAETAMTEFENKVKEVIRRESA